MTPVISVIVLNYNGRRWLAPCLSALAAQAAAPPFEVLLVDNGSSDGSLEVVKAGFPSVRIIDNGVNLGFAAGNNAGARAAAGELLVFLNNDTVAESTWLAALHSAHLGGPGRDLVTSKLVWLDWPEVVDSAGDGYLRAGGAYKRGHGAAASSYAAAGEVFAACGAAFLIRRALFESLGGFDERFFMVYEDVDLSYRARLRGHRVWFEPSAVVAHAGSGTLGVASEAAVFYGQRNLEWTWFKNTPGWLLLATLPAHALYSLAGVAHYVAAGRGGAAIRGKLAALVSLPLVWMARRREQRRRTVDPAAIAVRMTRGWLALKRREKSARLDLADHQHR